MTSREVTLVVWAALGLALVALEVASRFDASPVPSFRDLVTRAMRTPSGRVGVLAAWLWVGLHYFSR